MSPCIVPSPVCFVRPDGLLSEQAMCMACSSAPATHKNGTLPLCDACYRTAKENVRGVARLVY